MSNEKLYLGIDIGGTKIATCLVSEPAGETGKYTIIASSRIPGGSARGPDLALPQLASEITSLLSGAGVALEQVDAVGVCAPGPMDIQQGLMLASPNMPLWDKVPIVKFLSDGLKRPLFFQNDANGGVLAEAYYGNARNFQNVIYLTMSTGIGGGIVANGTLVDGINGLGGELGHVILDREGPQCGCGMNGCFEAFCGGKAMEKFLLNLLEKDPAHPIEKYVPVGGNPDMKIFQDAVEDNNPEALEIFDEYTSRLAQGVGAVIMTFNPEIVILGTIAYHFGDILFDPLKQKLPQYAWPSLISACQLRTSALGKHIGELAGAAVARYGLTRKV